MRPELTGIGARPAARASFASLGEAVGAGDLADELCGGQQSAAGLGQELRRGLGDELGDLVRECVDRAGQLSDAAQLVAGDPNTGGLFCAREAARDLAQPLAR